MCCQPVKCSCTYYFMRIHLLTSNFQTYLCPNNSVRCLTNYCFGLTFLQGKFISYRMHCMWAPPCFHPGFNTMPSGKALARVPCIGGSTTSTTAGDTNPPHGAPPFPAGSGASVSATLATLLPSSGPLSEGEYVGDSLPPVLAKVAAKILRGEFVELGELLPKFLASQRDDDPDGKRELKVTDILTWVVDCTFVSDWCLCL